MKYAPKMHRPAASLPFGEPERPLGSAGAHIAYVDGASRGNPGPASYAVVLRAPDGTTAFEIGKYLGRATNNVAEYYALITALDYAQAHGIARLAVRSDSELLVRQMQGRYKVKSPDLRPLYERAKKLAAGLAHFAIKHVPREQNREADELANLALDNTATPSGRGAVASGRAADAPSRAAPAAANSAAVSPASQRTPGNNRRIRARYSAGALHPLEPLALDEGEMVELRIEKLDRA
jgi:ribonuclease HI